MYASVFPFVMMLDEGEREEALAGFNTAIPYIFVLLLLPAGSSVRAM